MRYNRSLFTVYSFITHHLFQFCTKNFHLRPKQVFPPFLLSLFSYFCFKIKYHLILTKNENNLSFHGIGSLRHSSPSTRKAQFSDYPMRPSYTTRRWRLRSYTRLHPSYRRSSFKRSYLFQCLCRLPPQPTGVA